MKKEQNAQPQNGSGNDAKLFVSRRSETIKNLGKILDIMNRYKDEVDNGIYDHRDAMIEEIISRFTIISNGG